MDESHGRRHDEHADTGESTTRQRAPEDRIREIGRRLYERGFAAANDGNLSIRIGENEVLCTPTMICKGFMQPDDLCVVDLEGNQISGTRKRTSEILLHLEIMKARPDIRAVVHCHPPHATAFAVAREPIPQCVLPEIELFLGEVPLAPYETPGTQKFAESVLPFLQGTNTILLANHGTVSFAEDIEQAYWKTETLDAYCRILLLARQLGPIRYFQERDVRALLDSKQQLGFDDPRFHVADCDLCGNTAFVGAYGGKTPRQKAINPAPRYPGYLQRPEAKEPEPESADASSLAAPLGPNAVEALVRRIAREVLSELGNQ